MILSTEFEYLYLYQFWNSTDTKFKFNNNSQVIISNNATNGTHLSSSTQTYIIMSFGPLLAIFLTYYLLYGLLLTLFKHFRSTGFKLLSHGERCKEVVKLLFIPEVNEDCMSKKWKIDTLLLVVIQVASNLIMLVPFFVTGKIKSSKMHVGLTALWNLI